MFQRAIVAIFIYLVATSGALDEDGHYCFAVVL
jgi:hypothetical protein